MILGFSLDDKQWGCFSVASLKDIEWDDSIFDSLVLEDERKEFVHDLVKNHANKIKGTGFDDFVRDKGKGLIGLFSGPPGVGKTLTAEAIAEVAHRPIYKLSSGELGTHSLELQRQLNSVLELTQIWDAVLLLDEADVFLQERTDGLISTNAVTSIFLRELEYYGGILLLTTNRRASIDPAFRSRIHFCFDYTELDGMAKAQIWMQFLDKIRTMGQPKVEVTAAQIMELAKLPLNGREIKNVLSISQSVAKERKQTLDLEVIKLAERFSGTRLM
ncbi:P-loop containing nucleoside triphosphate hydrolase protein [Microthyrium microscopicum]|uniref:P-loop containing nucleoside triphosphate hydrolase protein n=1 Tax=Microthyrium microscopicum TaxID=703497 RepID=A0A6A6UF94_9PEZI|nr:P-loop containing nucleoside triphosphate hydrolase protein [Microthyrium microscopicum]